MREVWSKSGDWRLSGEIVLLGWTSGQNFDDRYTYFWADACRDVHEPVWYRLYPQGEEPGHWVPMLPKEKVFLKTGYVDDEPHKFDTPKVGGAEILPAGTYHLDFRTTLDGETLLLRGVMFRVTTRDEPRGGWQIK